MITSKQRAFLRSIANTTETIFQIGKSGLTPEITESVNDALEAREIVKLTILKNCAEDIREVAQIISERTHSEIVQVIGRKIVFYRQSKDHKKIELPK